MRAVPDVSEDEHEQHEADSVAEQPDCTRCEQYCPGWQTPRQRVRSNESGVVTNFILRSSRGLRFRLQTLFSVAATRIARFPRIPADRSYKLYFPATAAAAVQQQQQPRAFRVSDY